VALRVALLGTGVIAAQHAIALRALQGAVDLIAVCDKDRAKGEAFRAAWAIPEFYEDLQTMIARATPAVIHVLLPPPAHARATIDCLEGGCDVFVEKPFCLTSEECRSVLKAGDVNKRRIGVDHNLTFMPAMLKMIHEIRKWRLGEVQHVTVNYNVPMLAQTAGRHEHWMFGAPDRILFEIGPHPISVIYRLIGSVTSAATTVSGKRILNNNEIFYDTWQSSLVCERGTAQFVLALGGEYLNTWVHVVGQDGEAFADLRRNTFRFSEKTRYPRADNLVDGWKNGTGLVRQSVRNFRDQMRGAFGIGPAYEMQTFSINTSVEAFYRALASGEKLPVSGQDGAAVVQACEAVIESAWQFVGEGRITPIATNR
jgi:predicted dehydrogenase